MKALVYSKREKFKIEEIEVPIINNNQLLIRVKSCGICGSDVHIHEGRLNSKYPLIPGHEFSGIVEKIGANVRGFQIGDRIACDNTIFCGICYWCKTGKPLFCENAHSLGGNTPGGFAEYVKINYEKCYKISENISFDEASFSEPTACAIHGMDNIDLSFGDEVLIFGSGSSAIIIAQLLKYGGASKVVVAASRKFKLDVLNKLGINDTVQIEKQDWEANNDKIKILSPKGFDVVIDVTGASSVIKQALKHTKKGAKLIIYGVCKESEKIEISPYEIFEKELKIIGSFCQALCFDRAVKYLERRIVKVKELITHKFNLEEYRQAINLVISGNDSIKVIINP